MLLNPLWWVVWGFLWLCLAHLGRGLRIGSLFLGVAIGHALVAVVLLVVGPWQ